LCQAVRYPYLNKKKITNSQEQQNIAREMLTGLKDTLLKVQSKFPQTFILVDTQGTLDDSQWRNEIHPTPEGFKLISNLIRQRIN
jgi:hypothetical protein